MNGKRNGRVSSKHNGFAIFLIARLARPVIRHLSELASESLKQPGSWQCLEIIYRNEPRKILDRFFLNSRSARGARNRLQILKDEICKCIEQRSRINNPVRMISFGSGPGHEVIGCIERLRSCISIEATCIDKEPSALAQGRLLTAQKGLGKCIEYIQGNILHANSNTVRHDIGILSGLVDYFSFETAVSVLKMIRERLLPGGTVLIANMRQHKLASTMSILGNWNLVYREPNEVESILVESGYKDIEVWLEPEEVFCIGKGRKPR